MLPCTLSITTIRIVVINNVHGNVVECVFPCMECNARIVTMYYIIYHTWKHFLQRIKRVGIFIALP
jgi:hypothetical protein